LGKDLITVDSSTGEKNLRQRTQKKEVTEFTEKRRRKEGRTSVVSEILALEFKFDGQTSCFDNNRAKFPGLIRA
jgi:hypothetical protein